MLATMSMRSRKHASAALKVELTKARRSEEEEAGERAALAEKIGKEVAERMKKNKGKDTKIGWFKYYKAAELTLTNEDGKKEIYAQHKWAKIPTPKYAKNRGSTTCSTPESS